MPDEYNVKKKKLSFKGETKTYHDNILKRKDHALAPASVELQLGIKRLF
jgi:hypothetical protein